MLLNSRDARSRDGVALREEKREKRIEKREKRWKGKGRWKGSHDDWSKRDDLG